MERSEQTTRDRAILVVRIATFGGVLTAVGITWLFANLSVAYFSGKPAPAPRPPQVPLAAAPKQVPPTVITTVVHHPSSGGQPAAGGGQPAAPVTGPAPQPPAQAPAPAPPPPPPPVCHSTPSHPC